MTKSRHRTAPSRLQRILFIELLGGIGDLLLALPAIHALARTHAPAHMTVLTFPPGGDLTREDPYVQQMIHAGPDAGAAVAEVLERRFDLVVSDSRHSGIPELLETRAEDGTRVVDNLWRKPPTDELIDLRFLEILATEGLIDPALCTLPPRVYLTPAELSRGRQRLDAVTKTANGPVVLLVPEAGMTIKGWPIDRWAALAQAVNSTLSATVVAVTDADEQLPARAVDGVGTAIPRLPLREIAAVLAAADVCVAGDTGLARLAAAVGTRTVCLFGPSWAGRFGLRAEHRNLSSPLPCAERNPHNMTEQACWYSGQCVFPDRSSCMDDISVASALESVEDMLVQQTMKTTRFSNR